MERIAMHDEAKWHWGEGVKYAVDAIKALLVINGAAAVAMLTFIGNTKLQSGPLIVAMACFAIGASMGVFTQLFAYLTQLHYGNASQHPSSDAAHQKKWATAVRWHNATYFGAGIALLLFVTGVGVAACGLSSFSSKQLSGSIPCTSSW
jgi:hypothetical protein